MRKTEQLSVRMTEIEMSRLRALAAKDDVRLSELVRGLISTSAQQHSLSPGLFQRLTGGMVPMR